MNTTGASLYLYSEDAAIPGLPVRSEIVRYLSAGGTAMKAAELVLAEPVYQEHLSSVVVLAKGTSLIDEAFKGDVVGVYVMPLDSRAGVDSLDIAGGLQPVVDWGALTTDLERAKRLQVKYREA